MTSGGRKELTAESQRHINFKETTLLSNRGIKMKAGTIIFLISLLFLPLISGAQDTLYYEFFTEGSMNLD